MKKCFETNVNQDSGARSPANFSIGASPGARLGRGNITLGALVSVVALADGETSPKLLSTKPASPDFSFSAGNRTAAAHFPK
jgi:hypothetical protein